MRERSDPQASGTVIQGPFPQLGGVYDDLPRGELGISRARELLVVGSLGGAYEGIAPFRQDDAKPLQIPAGDEGVELVEQGAVRFSQALVPEPAWRLGGWTAPEIRDIHRHARLGLAVERFEKSPYPAQHRYLNAPAHFAPLLASLARVPRLRREGFVFLGGFRLLIPDALQALSATVAPDLLDDPRIASFADPERGEAPGRPDGLESLVLAVLREPLSAVARRRLAGAFEERGEDLLALEQRLMVGDLTDDPSAELGGAGILARLSETERETAVARRARALESDFRGL